MYEKIICNCTDVLRRGCIGECYKRLTNIMKKIDNYNYEIIVVNDGSKDNTLEILEEIAQKDKNVKVISFQETLDTKQQ